MQNIAKTRNNPGLHQKLVRPPVRQAPGRKSAGEQDGHAEG